MSIRKSENNINSGLIKCFDMVVLQRLLLKKDANVKKIL